MSANSTSGAVAQQRGRTRSREQQTAAALKIPAAESTGSLCAGTLKYAPQPGAVFRLCVDILTEYIKNHLY